MDNEIHGYSVEDWEKAKLEAERFLIQEVAKLNSHVFYSDLAAAIKTIHLDAHGTAMSHFLAQISEKTFYEHGFMLSALVVSKAQKIPGMGFFELAKQLYEDDVVYTAQWHYKEKKKIFKYARNL